MTTSAINLEKAFKAAIAAYQKGDYKRARSLLTQLTKAGSRTYWLKASMGIVQVYIAQKQWAEAEELCRKIYKKTSIPAPQKWAKETLASIEGQQAKSDRVSGAVASVENKSGFQPIETGPKIIHEQTPTPQISIFHYTYLNDEIEEIDVEAGPMTESTSVSKSTSATESSATDEGHLWIYAGRLKQGRSLGRVKRGQLRMAQIGSAIALYFLLRFLIHQTVSAISGCLSFLDGLLPFWVRPLPDSLREVTWTLLVGLLVTAIVSPRLWDLYLRVYADRQKLTVSQLRIHSPESASLINRYCRRNLPTLWKLPTDIPLIFSYGWLPRNARLVVSEGLLCELKEDEIAALFSYELSHWKTWYWPLLSTQGLMLQMFHQIYWQLALWGDKQRQPLKVIAGTVANLSYGLFWLVRLPGLWVARVRTYYGDHAATEITGNPNGLIRGLTKLSFGLAASVGRQGYTPGLVESLATLMPVCADLSRQKLYGHLPLAELFAWDSQNPLRNWMGFFDSQPPLGNRLCAIAAYAKHWKLTPEIPFTTLLRKRSGLSKHEWKRLFSQGTPYLGLGLGAVIGAALWGVGAIASALEWPILDWMHKDAGLFQCCLLLGAGVGTILRINHLFPDLSFSMQPSQAVPEWTCSSQLLPVDSLPTKLTGTVLGRPGIANWLGQDMHLQTPFGLIKLHFFTVIGPLGNLLNRSKTPRMVQGESVQILGWFRRSTQPYLDIDKIRLSDGTMLQATHPLYSLLLAAIASGLGLWLLLQSTGYTG